MIEVHHILHYFDPLVKVEGNMYC